MSRNFEDFDEKNIEIAKMLINDSEKITIDEKTNEKIIKSIRNGRKKKFTGIYKMATAVAACIVLVAGMTIWNHVNTKEGYKSSSEKMYADNYATPSKINKNVQGGKFADSYDEIKSRLKEEVPGYKDNERGVKKSADAATDGVSRSTGTGKNNYSKTNEQTEGVHEGDSVKTDGKYIYTLTEKCKKNGEFAYNKVVITEATNGNMKNISTIMFDEKTVGKQTSVREIYVENNRLVAIASTINRIATCGVVDDVIARNKKSKTYILIYDISDIKNPKLISKNNQDGSVAETRIVNGYLYTISSWDADKDDCIPYVNEKKVECKDIFIPDVSEDNSYSIITSINIDTAKKIENSVSVLGSSSDVYVSGNNIYLISQVFDEEDVSDDENYKAKIDKYVKNKKIDLNKKTKIKYHYALDEIKADTKKRQVKAIKRSDKSEIIKYSYKDGKITFIAGIGINGRIDDRFSLDEKDGYLRLVAHVSEGVTLEDSYVYYKDGKHVDDECINDKVITSTENNSVYTFDSAMKKKGEILGLAKNEDIYAARYLGNYGYFVTYEQTDPLFTVDFTDMANPKITGALKIPGYSDYLQMFDENNMLGIGVNDENEPSKLKIDMYGISGKKAERKASYTVKKESDSDALYDSKALLADSEKNIIGIPVYEDNYSDEYYSEDVYYYLFKYENNRFKQLLRLKLGEQEYSDVRGFYIDNYLYVTDCSKAIWAVNMADYSVKGKISIK